MRWAAAECGLLLALLVPALYVACQAERRRQRLPGVPARARSRWWMTSPAWPMLVALALMIVALCRPQWGVATRMQQQSAGNILIALDVSRSMLADDLRPHRLHVARQAISGLLPHLQGERIGLLAFAGSAFLVCPLTSDYDSFDAALAEIGPETFPLGGTALAAALREAQRVFAAVPTDNSTLIIVSDGEDHRGEPLPASPESGLPFVIHAVAAGTAAGGPIPLADGSFVRDRAGEIVRSRLHGEILDRLAVAGGGKRVDLAADPQALVTLYRSSVAGSARNETAAVARGELAERFQWPLLLAVLLLFGEPLRNRRG